jgi:Domain of unknown function (DUF3854)
MLYAFRRPQRIQVLRIDVSTLSGITESLMNSLLPSDVAMFERLRIPAELVTRAGVLRVTDREARVQFGIRGGGDMSGLAFPYWEPSSMKNGNAWHRWYVRIRRDHPDLDGRRKYIVPYRDRRHLYFPPCPEWFSDASIALCLVEAEKSALALLAWSERTGRKILPIAIGGCWGWRGKVGIITTATGERVPEHDVLPDLNICRDGRKAFVLLDSNATTNDKVGAARAALARQLQKQGAAVTLLGLPLGDWNGPDDFVSDRGDDAVAALFDSAAEHEQKRQKEAREQKSQASHLVDIGRVFELFHTPEGVPYAVLNTKGHRETWGTGSRTFREALALRYYQQTGSSPNSQAIRDAIATLDGIARFDGACHDVHVRVAGDDKQIWLDLCNSHWNVVEITANGWRVASDPPVRFRRAGGMLPLPLPEPGGSVDELNQFINVPDDTDEWVMVLSWLANALRPRGPYPILYLMGEQGCAKSTAARVVRAMVDPFKAPLRSAPRDERDLCIAANNSRVLALDNISYLPHWLSDALCRLATGGGLATRQLYTDSDEVVFEVMRPVVMNGIEDVATRGDFVERSIPVTLPVIGERNRRAEANFWRAFEEARPRILDALLDAVSTALSRVGSVHLERMPRMADFAVWSTAAETGLGFQPGTLEDAYSGNRATANETALEAVIVSPYVRQLVNERGQWSGTFTKLLAELNRLEAGGAAQKKPKGWPGTPRKLSADMRRLAPHLRAVGIECEISPSGRGRNRTITLRRTSAKDGGNTSRTSPTSPLSVDSTSSDGDVPPAQTSSTSGNTSPVEVTGNATFGEVGDVGDVLPDPCYVHGAHADWWQRPDGTWVCGKCHWNPEKPRTHTSARE